MNYGSSVAAKVCAVCGARYPSDALFCPNDGAPLQSPAAAEANDPYLGQELSGHIEIRQLVGIGAMGRVYRAFQNGIDRDVAVKVLHRELSSNAQLVSRFTREAKVASRLSHPNVVQVFLAGQLPDRALYMVMEYLDGLSLQSALAASGGALGLTRAMHVALQLCDAVGEAHAQGIVHRDLKPENVMLVRRGTDEDFVKVLDFGIARINWGEQSVATAAGLIFGTARYISPEGAQGHTVGPESDVYSIASLVYQMLSGRTPFEGDQAVALLVQQIHDKPPPLGSLPGGAHVPEPIAAVVMTNLAKDPKDREPDARALGHAFVDALRASGMSTDEISRPTLKRPSTGPSKIVSVPPARTNGSNGRTREPMAATAKWEPPTEFQAKLRAMTGPGSSPEIEKPTGSRPRLPSHVDETLDDASADAPVAFPAPSSREDVSRAPRTLAADRDPPIPTQYSAPIAAPPSRPSFESAPPRVSGADEGRSARGVVFVVACFVIGVALTAGVAWRMGKIGGGPSEQDRIVALATDAMYRSRFAEPPGENVREITTEGLRRFPGEKRLLDIRVRAASELVNQALSARNAGDIADALKLARLAYEFDPTDSARKRLVDQYEAELAAFASPTAPPLASSAPLSSAKVAPSPPQVTAAATPIKILVDVSVPRPRLGQTVDLFARVAPARTKLDDPGFSIVGPDGQIVRMVAEGAANGTFRARHVFVDVGKYEIVFVATVDGKALRGTRAVVAGEPVPALPSSNVPVAPAPSASVKWM